jgi:hypothetical protein
MAEQKLVTRDYDIYIYLNQETGKVETIVSYGLFGTSEYDPEAARWVALGLEDTWRLRDLSTKADMYKVDWDNDSDFDIEGKNVALKKFSDGTLDKNYLKKNTILVREALSE